MRSKKDGLLELAAAIADGSAVDWDRVESGASEPELRSLVDQLRLIAMIAGAHSTQDQPPEPPASPGYSAQGARPDSWSACAERAEDRRCRRC